MNPDVARLWADALESGEYKQGRGALCSVTETGETFYCCLGVLCELAISQGLPVNKELTEDGRHYRFDGSGGRLPRSVFEWADTKPWLDHEEDPEGLVGVDNPMLGERSAITLNDADHATFEDIAAAIRDNLIPQAVTA